MKAHLRIGSIILLLSVGLVLTGCSKSPTYSAGEYSYASVRLIHSAPSTELIDFAYLGYDAEYYVVFFTGASYGEQSGYFSFVIGSRSFRAYLADSSLTLANITISLTKDDIYTVIATDLNTAINPELLVIADTTEAPESGKAFLRFVHVSADAPVLNILKADSSLLVTDLAHYEASAYVELDAGTYEFIAVSASNGTELLTLDPLTIVSGANYTVLLSGSVYGLPGSELNAKIYQEKSVE